MNEQVFNSCSTVDAGADDIQTLQRNAVQIHLLTNLLTY